MEHTHKTDAQLAELLANSAHEAQAAVDGCPECSARLERMAAPLQGFAHTYQQTAQVLDQSPTIPNSMVDFAKWVETPKKSSLSKGPFSKSALIPLAAAAALMIIAGTINYTVPRFGTPAGALTVSSPVTINRPGLFFGNVQLTTTAIGPKEIATVTDGYAANLGMGSQIQTAGSASFRLEQTNGQLSIELLKGNFRMRFAEGEYSRTVILDNMHITITGTELFFEAGGKSPRVYLRKGKAKLRVADQAPRKMKAGRVYIQKADGLKVKKASAKSLKTFKAAFPQTQLMPKKVEAEAKTNPKGVETKFTLYNGDVIYGRIVKLGSVLTIETTKGVVKVPKGDIADIEPLP